MTVDARGEEQTTESGQAYMLSLLGSPCRAGVWPGLNVNPKSSPGREELKEKR